jgi:hypothetical protein
MSTERDLAILRKGTLRDRVSVLERFCVGGHLNYLPIEILSQDGGKVANKTLLIGKYVPGRVEFWPIYALYVEARPGRTQFDKVTLTTGYMHKSWAFPLLTHDMMLDIKPSTRLEDVEAFFDRIGMLPPVHRERLRRLQERLSERECNDLFVTLWRELGYSRTATDKFFKLLPVRGERLSGVDLFCLFTSHCRHRNPFTRSCIMGRLADHLIQKLEPLHQRGAQVVFRIHPDCQGVREVCEEEPGLCRDLFPGLPRGLREERGQP